MQLPLRLTRAQVREVDRIAIERFGVPGIVLMENAARAVVDAAMQMLHGKPRPAVTIACGGGNNGGDGLAVARHLHNRGVAVTILLIADPAKLRGDALINWNIVQAMNLPVTAADALREAFAQKSDLIIDALLGTGLTEPPRGSIADAIDAINRTGVPVLAVDLPSGLDCDTGQPPGPHDGAGPLGMQGASCVRAARTITFVAEKAGFANPAARSSTGEVAIGDIGCPREAIDLAAGRPASPPA